MNAAKVIELLRVAAAQNKVRAQTATYEAMFKDREANLRLSFECSNWADIFENAASELEREIEDSSYQ
jgi:hypothetical protein